LDFRHYNQNEPPEIAKIQRGCTVGSQHQALHGVTKKRVADLADALNDPSTKTKAAEIIRSLLSEIRQTPEDSALVNHHCYVGHT